MLLLRWLLRSLTIGLTCTQLSQASALANEDVIYCEGAATILAVLRSARIYGTAIKQKQEGLPPDLSKLPQFGHDQEAATDHAQAQRMRLRIAYSLMKAGRAELFKENLAEFSDAMRSSHDRGMLTGSPEDWRDYSISLEASGVALIYGAVLFDIWPHDVADKIQRELLKSIKYVSRSERDCAHRTRLALGSLSKIMEAK